MLIDYNMDVFIQESTTVMYYTKGGISLKELEEMPFNIFQKYLDEAMRIQKELSKDEQDG